MWNIRGAKINNTAKMKIIHWDGDGTYPIDMESQIGESSYFKQGWASNVAEATLKYTDKYEIEKWRSDPNTEIIREKRINGVTYKLFPSLTFFPNRDFPVTISPQLLKQLFHESRKGKVLLHQHITDSYQMYLSSWILRNSPYVAHDHGGYSPLHRYLETKKLVYFFMDIFQRKSLEYIDYYLAACIGKLKLYESQIEQSVRPTMKVFRGGVDFKTIKPILKTKARSKLGISNEKLVLLYVGRYFDLKGVDYLLEIYNSLKKNREVELILAGGSSADPLYNRAKTSGAIVTNHRLDRDTELPYYYSAADVYVLPKFDSKASYSYGVDTAIVESLACGTPVVSTMLQHFENPNDVKHIGIIPKDIEHAIRCINYIDKNPQKFEHCRQIAKKYYDWKVIINFLLNTYDELFQKYYPEIKENVK